MNIAIDCNLCSLVLLDKIAANEWQLSISFQYEGVCFKFYYKLITT